MLELYSLNVEVAENGSVPFNNVNIVKGQTATHSAPASVELNKKGIYMVQVNGSAALAESGTVSVQLAKNGMLQAQAQSIASAAASTITPFGFTTLVQVPFDNTCACNTAPTTLQLINTGLASTFSFVQMVVTKVC